MMTPVPASAKHLVEVLEGKEYQIPTHMHRGIVDYIAYGLCGNRSFMFSLLSNDLVGAFGKADEKNVAKMRHWASFLYNEMPPIAWGSEEKVRAWIARGGIEGQSK